MSQLLIDMGNSCIKVALLEQDLGAVFTIKELSELTQFSKPHQIIISSVTTAEKNHQMQIFCQQHWQITPQFLVSQKQCLGLINGYYKASQLGVDRWLAMLAVWQQIKSNFCIIDCGTAVTLDMVNQQGEHQGGLILPGLELMQQPLLSSTSLDFTPKTEFQILAKETATGIYSGCIQAIAGIIERLIRLNPTLNIILSGGYGDKIATLLPFKTNYQANLVLQGIQLIIVEDKIL